MLDAGSGSASPWWQEGVGYQIWPASFKDSNGDGIGDLNGIISELHHVQNLGADFIWLSPVYDSPQADAGYDVRDYENIWPPYGSLQDMDRLIAEAKHRNLKVVMDLVVNHTSDEHRWFLEARKSRDNPFSDWYLWREPRYDSQGRRRPPNNWRAAFGGSVWSYVPERDQYYLHLCQPHQPDLNWHNPAVRDAVYRSAVDFWLRRGVDGFRIDVVNFYWKDPAFPDARVTVAGAELQPMEARHVMNNEAVRGWLRELRGRIAADHGRPVPLIGELPGVDRDGVLAYMAGDTRALEMVFDMDILLAGNGWNRALHELEPARWPAVKAAVLKTQSLLDQHADADADGAWPTAFLENHDSARSVSAYASGAAAPHRAQAAKMLAVLLGSLSGTLFIYQGQEIGMTNVPGAWQREDFRDCATVRYLDDMDANHLPDDPLRKRALEAARRHGRDNARTPVQWSAGPHAGFSSVQPWIKVNDNYQEVNVAAQMESPDSVLAFWQRIVGLRKQHRHLFIHGRFEALDLDADKTFCFLKHGKDVPKALLVLLNLTGEATEVPTLPGLGTLQGKDVQLLIGTHGTGDSNVDVQTLKPWEGRIYTFQS